MASRSNITPELCRQLLRYEPITGKLFWLTRTEDHADLCGGNAGAVERWNSTFCHREALTATNACGYRIGRIAGCQFNAHRVAWAITHGAWPDYVDHINGDRTDNRLSNLRNISPAENARNMAQTRLNKSGITGVSFCAQTGKWRASIRKNGKLHDLGRFEGIADAAAARAKASANFGFHPNHGRS